MGTNQEHCLLFWTNSGSRILQNIYYTPIRQTINKVRSTKHTKNPCRIKGKTHKRRSFTQIPGLIVFVFFFPPSSACGLFFIGGGRGYESKIKCAAGSKNATSALR